MVGLRSLGKSQRFAFDLTMLIMRGQQARCTQTSIFPIVKGFHVQIPIVASISIVSAGTDAVPKVTNPGVYTCRAVGCLEF